MPPKCKDCGGEHWMIEGCRLLSGGEADRVRRAAVGAPAVAAAELRAISRSPHVELEPYGVANPIRDNPAAKVSNDAVESLQSEPGDGLKFPEWDLPRTLPVWPPEAANVPLEDLAAFDRAQMPLEPSGTLGSQQELASLPIGLAAGGLAGGFGLAPIRTEGAVNDDPLRGGQPAPLLVTENGTYQGGLLVSDPVPSLGQGVIEKYDVKKTYSLKAQRILKARQTFGLSQTKFAKLFGLTCETIYNWEKDRQTQPGWFMFIVNMIEREPRAVRRAMNMIPPKKRVLIPGKLLEGK